MATEKVTEPAPTAEAVQEPAETPTDTARERVYVYDKNTGEKLRNPVPRSWLDGRFPNLSETPSKKAGK